jgi:hypothetical protein
VRTLDIFRMGGFGVFFVVLVPQQTEWYCLSCLCCVLVVKLLSGLVSRGSGTDGVAVASARGAMPDPGSFTGMPVLQQALGSRCVL